MSECRAAATAKRATPAASGQALLTLAQVRAVYGLPPSSVRDLLTLGALPAVRLPGSRRIWLRRVDLDALIASSVAA